MGSQLFAESNQRRCCSVQQDLMDLWIDLDLNPNPIANGTVILDCVVFYYITPLPLLWAASWVILCRTSQPARWGTGADKRQSRFLTILGSQTYERNVLHRMRNPESLDYLPCLGGISESAGCQKRFFSHQYVTSTAQYVSYMYPLASIGQHGLTFGPFNRRIVSSMLPYIATLHVQENMCKPK